MSTLLTTWKDLPLTASVPVTILVIVIVSIIQNVVRQLYFSNPSRPPVVFHWVPLIGSTIQYGIDPYTFFRDCRAKYGDCFTFILLGKPTTVFLGSKGNDFILNGRHADLNAEDVYGKLTTPIFGAGVLYDCSNEQLMDQKRLFRDGLSTDALRSYIPIFVKEVEQYIKDSPHFGGQSGECNITEAFSEVTIYTAAASLQGAEVRSKFDSTFATLYRHLDDAFTPINFMIPWLPTPTNYRRDRARKIMENLYSEIVQRRRKIEKEPGEMDMIWSLMESRYKDGTAVPDLQITRLLIALLMGGQHNTAVTGAWAMLNLAHNPGIIQELYREQQEVLGTPLPPLTWENLQKLKLQSQVIKETLRLHSPIHSILRQVTRPMPVPNTSWVIPPSHTLLAAPGFLGRTEEFFPSPMDWNPHRWSTLDLREKYDGDNITVNYGFGAVPKGVRSPYLPFGAGRHRCIGEQYAYAQLGASIATMVRLLEWEQVDPKAPIPATDFSSMFLRPMNPATIKWKLRV